jgi:hypothetical protein
VIVNNHSHTPYGGIRSTPVDISTRVDALVHARERARFC